MAGITPGLTSLLYTHQLFRKEASVGIEIYDVDASLDRLDAALVALGAEDSDFEARLAQVLAASVIVARAGGVDAESALRGWAADYRRRFEAAERDADAQGVDIATLWPDHPSTT